MLNLFEKFDQPSRDFLRSQWIAKVKNPTVVMHDDGFLPDEVDSPIKYFSKLTGKHLGLYFDHIKVPKYWRIVGDSHHAEIFDLDQKRAEVVYVANDNTRIVKAVQWLNGHGEISWVDHYDQHGNRFAQTIYNNGQAITRKYYNRDNRPVITQNLVVGDLFLDTKLVQRHFKDYIDFVIYFLRERHYKLNKIFYNTLNESLALTLRLDVSGEDTLFWHEKTGEQLPGNMKFLMENQTRTKHVVFQRYSDWQRHKQLLPSDTGELDFRYLGVIYPHPRSNHLHPQALILTNSDQIEQLGRLAKLLPKVHFNVAAVTEMSDKLLAFQDYHNIDLYPTVSRLRLKQLVADCDIYLDINHGSEILDAVRGAFEQNMLVLGFTNTIHQPNFVTKENVFSNDDVEGMAKQILRALLQPAIMKQLIDTQRIKASDVLTTDYQTTFGELSHEQK